MGWEPLAGLVISLVAVAVSFVVGLLYVRAEHASVSRSAVVDIYGDFRQITELRLNNWQHTHILEPPGNYERTKRLTRMAIGEPTEQEKAQLLLQERSVALGVFQLFEETLYQLNSSSHIDTARAGFLQDVLDYMTGCLLKNPRLLYLWAEEGGSLCADFEVETKQYYKNHVKILSLDDFDTEGLFGDKLTW
jgi:hypothetical protein